jgi:hypothetical protein
VRGKNRPKDAIAGWRGPMPRVEPDGTDEQVRRSSLASTF